SVMIVHEKSTNSILLAVNGKIDASSSGDLPTQLLSGHLPMLLAPRADNALVIGFASGITVGAVMQHPIEGMTAVEIEEAILEASRYFDPYNHRPLESPKVHVVRNDGRNFLLVTDEHYDVLISEPSNPWMTVAANLFTKEFFEMGRNRLNKGGVFAQWVQLYGMSPEDLKVLVRTFHSVFPHVMVFNTIEDADLILVGTEAPLTFDLNQIGERMTELSVQVDLRRIGVTTPQDLLTYFVFGDMEIDEFAGDGPLNTDDNALIEFHAPKSLHYETRAVNTMEVRRVTVDPTRYVTGLANDQERQAHALALTKAFMRRRMWDRARKTLAAEPALAGGPEGAELIKLIDTKRAAR
ncbi:MAG TPA: fused MFS/spermidine synthase, partial [Candidatus Polarisedimenticolia bacterium]|nr:fused MFS/spermidine synthase [Candidatus Polarisedimenticolia bacterium]